MKIIRIVLLVSLLALFSTPVWAVDYRADTTFSSQFSINDIVYDIFVQADGKIVAGGSNCQSSTGPCSPFLKRLNTDGTIDPTFNTTLTPVGSLGAVRSIKPLPNGQFLITGDFNIGSQASNYARLNANGGLDPTMTLAYLGERIIEPSPDGKFVACGPRSINGENYLVAHRLNSDGSPDPSFRITFMVGNCNGLKSLPNGKILMTNSLSNGQPLIKPLHRLNPDGSNDSSFEADVPIDSLALGLTELPDGKLLVRSSVQGQNNTHVKRLLPDGALDINIPLCTGSTFLPVAGGNLLTTNCKRWTYHYGFPLDFVRVLPDGNVDPTLDAMFFQSYNGNTISGFRDAGNDRYYVYGGFSAIQYNSSYRKLARLVPNLTPLKAKFDFDNDGKSDVSVFRPSNGYWYLNQSTAGFSFMYWGFPTDKPAATHFDTDGKTDIAIFRDGWWHAWSSVNGHKSIFIGAAGDKPMVGNFNDEEADLEDWAVRGIRDGVTQWFVRDGWTIFTAFYSPNVLTLPDELASDKPVVGDFNGDGRDDVGYFHDGVWNSFDIRGYQPSKTFQWGMAGDLPVPGDYDGDRQTDYAIFRPSTGVWWINRSTDGILAVQFGMNGDIPVPADYDGDGKVDVAVFRDGLWYQLRSASGTFYAEQWGSPGDFPIPAQNQ
jgi:uncharacterized delta-60 repeat protein